MVTRVMQLKTPDWICVLVITAVFMSVFTVMPAGATPPPREYLVQDMVPVSHDATDYFSENQPVCPNEAYNRTTHTWDVFVRPGQPGTGRFAGVGYPYPQDKALPGTAFPLFPVLSGYWKAENYWDEYAGNALIAFTGYYDNPAAFSSAKKDLLDYLGRQGNVTPVALGLDQVLLSSENPCIRDLNGTVFAAVRYETPDTAGYFLFHDTPDFSGDLYRIEYYGTTGMVMSVPEISAGSGYGRGYGRLNTANLSRADDGIRALIVKHVFNLDGTRADSYGFFNATVSPGPESTFFPALSPYHAGAMHVFLPSGKRFISEAWVFMDAEVFNRQRSELFRYLNETGNVSTTSLEFSGERGLAGVWDVTQYESRNTSGYFFTSTEVILYDGVVGPAGLEENSYPIQLLIADTAIPGGYTGPLDSPRAVPYSTGPTPVIFYGMAGMIVVAVVAVLSWRR